MMTSNPTTGTIAAGGISAMLGGVLIWLLSLFDVKVPADVALDIGALIVVAVGFVVHRLPAPPPDAVAEALKLVGKDSS